MVRQRTVDLPSMGHNDGTSASHPGHPGASNSRLQNEFQSEENTVNETTPPTVDQLSSDVQKALRSAEDMFHEATEASGDKAVELRERAMQQLKNVREKLQDAQEAVVTKSKAAARATDDYVHDHPWKAITAAAAAGVAVGLLLNRR